jgi:hypothetical protein
MFSPRWLLRMVLHQGLAVAGKTRVLAIAGGVVVAALAIWFMPFIRDSLFETTGSISVSGPQIYTRERLVNDRYREDAWLLSELEGSPKLPFGITSSAKYSTSHEFSVSASESDKSPEPTTSGAKSGPDSDKPSVNIGLDPFNRFKSLMTFREQVRSLMIENQLDDRHDLRGNSLYRLKFDAAVFPGINTRRSAKVTVSVLPPENMFKPDIDEATDNKSVQQQVTKFARLSDTKDLIPDQYLVWNRIYTRWLDSLDTRFDGGEKALRKAYEAGRFSPGYYKLLLEYIKSYEKSLLKEGITPMLTQLKFLRPKLLAELKKNKEGYYLASVVNTQLFDNIVKNEFKPGAEPGATSRTESQSLDYFFDSYGKGKNEFGDPVHRKLKMEIDLHITAVVNELEAYYVIKKQYQDAVAEDPGAETKPWNNRDEALRFFMHNVFRSVLSKSILGQEFEDQNSDSAGGGTKDPSIVSQLAMVEENPEQENDAYKFKPLTLSLKVTDAGEVTDSCIKIFERDICYTKSDLDDIKRLLPSYDIKDLIKHLDNDEDFRHEVDKWKQEDPVPEIAKGGNPHYYEIKVEVGLINFIRLVGRRLDAFSYAFTPSEPDEISATQALDASRLRLQAGGAISGNASLGSKAEEDWNDVRKLVIGFGKQANSTIPTFGWMIRPQEHVGSGQNYRQRASQLSLTALISLPAWWDEVTVRIKREWAPESQDLETGSKNPKTNGGQDPKPTGGGQDSEYTIELPVNFETIDAALFEKNNRSPGIEEWAAQPVELRVCDQKAALIIPGRRLWRSTIVTLGSQKANEIYVLPDMNGIIATFAKIEIPSSLPEQKDGMEDFHVPITVWTSQGSVTLPLLATIHKNDREGKPYSCPDKEDKVPTNDHNAELEKAQIQPQPKARVQPQVSSARAAAPAR